MLKISWEVFYRDGLVLLGLSFVFYFLAADGVLSPYEGLILLIVFISYVGYLFRVKPKFSRIMRLKEFLYEQFSIDRFLDFKTYKLIVEKGLDAHTYEELLKRGINVVELPVKLLEKGFDAETYRRILLAYEEMVRKKIMREFLLAFAGLMGVYLGSKYMIAESVELATLLGVSQNLIGLTLVSIGTTFPEFAVSITSARKGFGDMALGNVIGSNIANISLIAGLSSLVSPINIPSDAISYSIPFMILMSLMGVLFMRSGWRIQRIEGVIFITSCMLFMGWMIYSR